MALPREAVLEFQVVYEREFKRSLSFEEATDVANRVFNLFKLIVRPLNGQIIRLEDEGTTPTSSLPLNPK